MRNACLRRWRMRRCRPLQPRLAAAYWPCRRSRRSAGQATAVRAELFVTVGKSLVIDSPVKIQRISVANGDLAEAVAVNPKEVLINGKARRRDQPDHLAAGRQPPALRSHGARQHRRSSTRCGSRWRAISRTRTINVTFENDTAFVRGTVKDLIAAERVDGHRRHAGQDRQPAAGRRAAGGGPDPVEGALRQRGPRGQHRTWASTCSAPARSTRPSARSAPGSFRRRSVSSDAAARISHSQRRAQRFPVPPRHQPGRDHQGAGNQAPAEILAEPNVLAINGKEASFLAGGEFPFPMLQGGGAGWARSPFSSASSASASTSCPTSRRAAPSGCRWRRKSARWITPTALIIPGLHDSRALARAACRPKSNWRAGRAS